MMFPSFHLWLVPSGEARARLRAAIDELATEYGAPAFEPHLTLLSEVVGAASVLRERTVDLARGAGAVELRFTGVDIGQTYFQCVYLRAESTPPLLTLHELARARFGRSPHRFMPHLSLLYGDFDASVRAEIASRVDPDLCRALTAERIQLIRADSEEPRDWHVIAERVLR